MRSWCLLSHRQAGTRGGAPSHPGRRPVGTVLIIRDAVRMTRRIVILVRQTGSNRKYVNIKRFKRGSLFPADENRAGRPKLPVTQPRHFRASHPGSGRS